MRACMCYSTSSTGLCVHLTLKLSSLKENFDLVDTKEYIIENYKMQKNTIEIQFIPLTPTSIMNRSEQMNVNIQIKSLLNSSM